MSQIMNIQKKVVSTVLAVALSLLLVPSEAFASIRITWLEDLAEASSSRIETAGGGEGVSSRIDNAEEGYDDFSTDDADVDELKGSDELENVALLDDDSDIALLSSPLSLDDLVADSRTSGIVKNGTQLTVNATGLILLSNVDEDYSDYTLFLSTLGGGYADLTTVITYQGENYNFRGLGSDTHPFRSNIINQTDPYGVILSKPLFRNLDASITLTNLKNLKLQSGKDGAVLLAEKISGNASDSWSDLSIIAEMRHLVDGTTHYYSYPGALIGTVCEGAKFSVQSVEYAHSAEAASTSDAGLLCNVMEQGSALSIGSFSVSEGATVSVTAGNTSAAGGLIGLMGSSSRLSIGNKVAIDSSFTVQGGYAGGLVGSGSAVYLSGVNAEVAGVVIKAKTAGGGLFGKYSATGMSGTYSAYDGSDASTLKCASVSHAATDSAAFVGGIFGQLELGGDFGIAGAGNITVEVTAQSNAGGLVGQVTAVDDLEKLYALTISGTSNVAVKNTNKLTSCGTALSTVGSTEDVSSKGVYVSLTGTLSGTIDKVDELTGSKQYYGGFASKMLANSVVEIAAGATLSPSTSNKKIKYGGGVVGYAGKASTLRLAGTTDLSNIQFSEDYCQTAGSAVEEENSSGQVLGVNSCALVYGAKSWTLKRPTTVQAIDDIGNYGSVIRLGKNIGQGESDLGADGTGLSEDLIKQDAGTHKTVFGKQLAISGTTVTISSADDYALASIAEQSTNYFRVSGSAPSQGSYLFHYKPNIVVTSDIDLRNTGLGSLQRDHHNTAYGYWGTFDGKGKTITLAIGEVYGIREGGSVAIGVAGSGQIHRHSQVGLFAKLNGQTVKNLTVGGQINVWECAGTKKYVGGFTAGNFGNISFLSVNTAAEINCFGSGDKDSEMGGLIGRKDGGSLQVNYSSSGSVGTSLCNSAINGNGNTNVYFGGLMGYFVGQDSTISNVTLSGTITLEEVADARVGGLIARTNSNKKLTLKSISVTGQSVTAKATATCGGLLGYDWAGTQVVFGDKDTHSNGVAVSGESSVVVEGNAACGALVYTATGYWQVNHIALQKLSVNSLSGDLGLLLCRGKRSPGGGVYLELTHAESYPITSDSVHIKSTGGAFDELCTYTCDGNSPYITYGSGAVISIATANGKVDEQSGNSYQNRTTNNGTVWDLSQYNRYYYNLHIFRENAGGDIDTPGELTLWAAYRYSKGLIGDDLLGVNDAIRGMVIGGSSAESISNIDLTGCSYYPVNVDNTDLTVRNCVITFANQTIEESEAAGGTDSLVRTTKGTDDKHTPHYLMHTGLTINYANTSNANTDNTRVFTVSNVTLSGNVGKTTNGAGTGALVSRSLLGNTANGANHIAKLSIQDLTLSGLYVNAERGTGNVAPLIVNSVGSYCNVTVQGVTTKNYSGYSNLNPAATSLIGNAGGQNAKYINFAFEDINLSGRANNVLWAENTAAGAGTGGSIFSHATLLESFRYGDAASSGYYHFVASDQYTYGKEISQSSEFEDLEKWFYKTQDLVKDGGIDDFSSGYLPYVCTTKANGVTTDITFHELEVNVVKPDLDEGCGTYDDPYIISTSYQLELVAKFVNTGSATTGWKVNKVEDPAAVKTDANIHHGVCEVGKDTWDSKIMRAYLLSAYFKIAPSDGDELSLDNYAGLGTSENPFTGVIEGNNKRISIAASQSGGNINSSGLINVSSGSVVRNLTIEYADKVLIGGETAQGSLFEKNSNTVEDGTYFGGIVGTVKGGDTIIEGVSVSFGEGFTLISQDTRSCAGGFVGLVQGGGVVLRNMPEQNGLEQGIENVDLYVDAYVGRVLDGYVINETNKKSAASTFTGGNYSIPDIDNSSSSVAKLSWNGGAVAIGNAQQLIMFCDIVNSGSANKSSAYAYGSSSRARNADYSKIGNVSSATDSAFVGSRKDDGNIGSNNYPYLVTKYTDNPSSFYGACDGVSLSFSADALIDLSAYGNGYRGIGGRYNCTANNTTPNDGNFDLNTPLISGVVGNNAVLKVAIDQRENQNDNFMANAVGGLFNVLRHNAATVSNITINGTVKNSSGLESKTDATGDLLIERAAVGGFVGRDYSAADNKTLTLQGLCFGQSSSSGNTVYGESHTGGILGYAGSKAFNPFGLDSRNTDLDKTGKKTKNGSVAKLVDCSFNNIEVVAGESAGGLVGLVAFNSKYLGGFCLDSDTRTTNTFVIDNNYEATISGENVVRNFATDIQGFQDSYSNTYESLSKEQTANGVGSIVGVCANSCRIGNDNNAVNISGVKVYGLTSQTRTGGLIGFLTNRGTSNKYTTTISNVHLSDSRVGNFNEKGEPNTKAMADNCGGIVGTWYQTNTLYVNNCSVEGTKIWGKLAGGAVGYLNNSSVVFRGVVIDECVVYGGNTVGGVLGQCNSAGSKVYMLYDTTVSNCKFPRNAEYNGTLFGDVKGYANVHNALLKNNDFSQYSTTTTKKYGRVTGIGANVRAIGLSIYQSDELLGHLPKEETTSVTYAGSLTADLNGNKQYFVSDAYMDDNIDSGADLATKPTVSIPGLQNLLGRTLNPKKVIQDAADKNRSNNFRTACGITDESQNKVVTGIESTYGTEQKGSKLSQEDDFDVLLVDGDASVIRQYLNAATNGGYQTLLRVENWWGTRTTQRMRMTVSIDRYKYNSDTGLFEKANASQYPATLVFHGDTGEFTTTAQYDNENDTFTLITIKMVGEPTVGQSAGTAADQAKVTRTIHIPVIVRRMLQVDFTATMATGTVFDASVMNNYKTHALSSAGEDISGYLTVKYNSNASASSGDAAKYDWQSYMEGGGDLLGHFNMTLAVGTSELPQGSTVTLVDCQNDDKRYSAIVGSGGSNLTLFSSDKVPLADSSGNGFIPRSLSEMLRITAEKDSNGKWVCLGSSKADGATVRDMSGNYYRLKKDKNETATEFYTLSVGETSPEENYFVVISVPSASTYKMTLDSKGVKWISENTGTSAPPMEIHQIHRYNSQTVIEDSCEASFNYLDNYGQELTDNTYSEWVQIASGTTVEIPVDISDKVTFDMNNYEETDELYHQFVATLKKANDGSTTGVPFPSDAYAKDVNLYAYYLDEDGQPHYFTYDVEDETFKEAGTTEVAAVTYGWTCDADGAMRLPFATKDATTGSYSYINLAALREAAKKVEVSGKKERTFYLEAKATVQISYLSVSANSTIPTNTGEELKNYTQLDAASYLSFTENGLLYSTVKGSTANRAKDKTRKYYLVEERSAVVKLNYLNLNQLGINLNDEPEGIINGMLTMDVSNSEGFSSDIDRFKLLSEASSFTFSFGLKQKGLEEDGTKASSGNYGEVVNIGDFHNAMSIGASEEGVSLSGFTVTVRKRSDGSWPCYNSATGCFTIPVTFDIKVVGAPSWYSNYQVFCTAQRYMLKESEESPGEYAEVLDANFVKSEKDAFITYTFAKINVNGIWSTTQ